MNMSSSTVNEIEKSGGIWGNLCARDTTENTGCLIFGFSGSTAWKIRYDSVMEVTAWAQENFQKVLLIHEWRLKKNLHLRTRSKYIEANWKAVPPSNEVKFEILFEKHGHHILQSIEERDHPGCYQYLVTKPASLMVWRCVSAHASMQMESFSDCIRQY